jgi:two-component system, response regulator RegA
VDKRKQILIADDDPVTVQMLSGVLTEHGFAVSVAHDAMQAVMMAVRKPPDGLILDIGMPGGTGFQVLERLKVGAKTRTIPIMVLTALTDPALQARVRALGAKEFFMKPIAPDQLLQAVDRLLEPPAEAKPAS